MYNGLKNYLDILSKDYSLKIVIKDFKGILDDVNLYNALKSYCVHKTCYCMAIKDTKKLWRFCLYNHVLMGKKLSKFPQAYFGTCYAGVKEYVYPILFNDQVIGAITVGGEPIEQIHIEKILYRIAKKNTINRDQLNDFYFSSNIKPRVSAKELDKLLGIISEHISILYGQFREKENTRNDIIKIEQSYIISHAVEYIHQHFREDLCLDKITAFCHCSRSYLSHNFKKYLGISTKQYINQMRINEAKKRLLDASVSITNLAYELGFKDSNYFSKVFRDIEGMSPRSYMKSNES